MPAALKLLRAVESGIFTPPEFAQTRLIDGRVWWQAQCRRVGSVEAYEKLQIYGSGVFEGTSPSKAVAARKALSEGLERWAFRETRHSPGLREKFGFNLNDSTDGMGAFPDFITKRARTAAYAEAIERWAIQSWWSGNLEACGLNMPDRLQGLRILLDVGVHVVIVWTDAPLRTYGFAGGFDLTSTVDRALVELSRNVDVLVAWGDSVIGEDQALIEKRLLYFSRGDGRKAFDERLVASFQNGAAAAQLPRILIDREIHGPWSKFATVWRVVLDCDESVQDPGRLEWFAF